MDLLSIQIGDGYQQVDTVLRKILKNTLSLIEKRENQEYFLKTNSLHTLTLVQYIAQQYISICDCEYNYALNWSEDIEPIPNKIDSMQAFRVPTKQKQIKVDNDKQINVPAQKIKLSVDINTILTKELQEEKKRLQREYIEKYSQLNFITKGSKSPSRDLQSQSKFSLEQFKPWELSYAHFNSRQKPFMQMIKQNENKIQEEQNQQDRSKFFIRKILSKEAIKRATEKAEKEEKERQIIPQESENLFGKIFKSNIKVFRAGDSKDLLNLTDISQYSGMLEQEEQNMKDDILNQKQIEFTDFFATQVQQEEQNKVTKAYFSTIKALSPNSVKPLNLRHNFPKAPIPQLVDVPLAIIKQKFKKDNLQLLEEKIAKAQNPNKLEEIMLKKMKNIRVRSNSPQNIDRNNQKSPQYYNRPALKDNVKYLINPDLKCEENEGLNLKILPNLDFKQVTKQNYQVSNKLK
ncbi:hypothetical protein TTHERM_00623080 (macronuclear) [Tetrahymena thermophila SB210]|uniref:Uncharacterized protein n=1 Tax=Tetrahymena thermophila (strain SB210) TaxID=312017 RepID=Q240X6_TETTS|nr:hypothetical protein TTHERM_00623080 [Tetrahymena thermophila SB210]EAS02288.2 hypothetical protein TTHERM_00623080 [Tetrahymena thermophila SB210]|eukprot:XP_001022533.2 hypothetical protein TTHERM_00623080 [Tetrahymena thermophila SB210]